MYLQAGKETILKCMNGSCRGNEQLMAVQKYRYIHDVSKIK